MRPVPTGEVQYVGNNFHIFLIFLGWYDLDKTKHSVPIGWYQMGEGKEIEGGFVYREHSIISFTIIIYS